MKKLFILCCLMLTLPAGAQAADEKIDPSNFICAELVAISSTSGQPPLFEGLQIDGYAAAAQGKAVADPDIMAPLLEQVYAACQAKPTEKVVTLWQEARKNQPVAADGPWRADKTTCKDYNANEDDGSGFVIWAGRLQPPEERQVRLGAGKRRHAQGLSGCLLQKARGADA